MKRTLFVLAALGAFAVPALASEASMELRVFNVSAITHAHPNELTGWLGPLRHQNGAQEAPEPSRLFEGDALCDLIRTRIEPSSWDGGGSIEYRESGVLVVKNTPKVLDEIAALLKDCDQAASHRVTLAVKLYELSPDRYSDVIAGADPAALEKANARVVESGSIQMTPGSIRTLRITNRVRYVRDYEVEIAQGAELSDPIVASDDEGLSIELSADPTLDGSRIILSAVTQSGHFEKPFRTVELGVDEEDFAHPFRSDHHYRNGRLELPVYSEQDSSATALLKSGEPLSVPVVRDGRLFVLRIVPTLALSGGPPWLFDIATLAGKHRSAWFGFPRELEPPDSDRTAPGLHFDAQSSPLHFLQPSPGFGQPEVLMDLITANVDSKAWENGQNSINVCGKDQLVIFAADDLRSKVAAFLGEREKENLRFVTLDLRVYSVAGPVDAGEGKDVPDGSTLLYAACLPTRVGIRTGVEAGSRAAYLADYDVEVAQDSRIADPNVGYAFDGMVANLTPTLNVDGSRVIVDLEMLLAHRSPFETFRSGTQYLGPIDEFHADRAVLNQTFQTAANGSYVIDAGVDPRTPGHHLAVLVKNHVK